MGEEGGFVGGKRGRVGKGGRCGGHGCGCVWRRGSFLLRWVWRGWGAASPAKAVDLVEVSLEHVEIETEATLSSLGFF